MTQTLTTERLREIASSPSFSANPLSHEVKHMARELLANREAQPVAWRYRTTDINGNPNPRWSFSEEASLMGLYQPLYTAPPAPADAQPVAWLAIYHGEVYDEAISITRSVAETHADRFGWESALTEIIPLYRHAPPAPAVPRVTSIPDAATLTNINQLCPMDSNLSQTDFSTGWNDCRQYALTHEGLPPVIKGVHAAAQGWNACRAAMLNGGKS